jgi:hypothetical protein
LSLTSSVSARLSTSSASRDLLAIFTNEFFCEGWEKKNQSRLGTPIDWGTPTIIDWGGRCREGRTVDNSRMRFR